MGFGCFALLCVTFEEFEIAHSLLKSAESNATLSLLNGSGHQQTPSNEELSQTAILSHNKPPLTSSRSSMELTPTASNSASTKDVSVTSRVSLLHRLNATEILEHFAKEPLRYEQIPELLPAPVIDDFDMAAIYSRSAWLNLRNVLQTRDATMFVSAGSSLTGVADVPIENRCHNVFAKFYQNLTVVDRAHSARNTFHTAQLMHSYFPAHADIILWEFAINDATDNTTPEEQRNQFILYMEQVMRLAQERQQEPPLVILLYLWVMPFSISPQGKIAQPTFHAHNHLGEHYDFVVGHVNAAKYVESLTLGHKESKAFLIADHHHPNERGHMVLAYLLNDLVLNEKRSEKPKALHQTQPAYTWMCGNETREKRLVQELLVNRHPVASYTEELPKNDKVLPGMLDPVVLLANATVTSIDSLRYHRKPAVILPCCGVASIKFDVSRYNPLHGIQTFLWPNHVGATIIFDGEDVTDKIISAHSWDCLTRYKYGYFIHWLALGEERNVSEITFCNNLPNCRSISRLALTYIVIYGGKRHGCHSKR